MRDFQNASPAEREKMMQEFNNLPADVQARIRGVAGGPAPGGQPQSGQPSAGSRGAGGRQPGGGPPGGGGRRGGRGGPGGGPGVGAAPSDDRKAEPDSDDPKWLRYDADQVKAGAPSGFLDWKPFKHPQLGDVEIGGFIPGFKLNPPDTELPRLADEQTKFITAIAAKAPKLVAEPVTVTKLGAGLYRVAIRIVNEGAMASMPQINTKARHGLPTLLTMDVPLSRLVSGEKIVRSWIIPAQGTFETEWTITGDDGSTADILFRPSIGPKSTIHVELKEAAK
jgi:hypothetical protein